MKTIQIGKDLDIEYGEFVWITDRYSDEVGQIIIDKSDIQAIIDALIKIKAEMDKEENV